jgi:fructose-bisphosphate aldolase class II
MTWSSTGYVIAAARAARWTAAAFAAPDLRRAGMAIAAAEASGVPAIVEVTADAAGAAASIPAWVDEARMRVEAARVPIALHLAARPSRGLMRRAALAGFSSVRSLIPGSFREPELEVVRRAAFWAHENGLLVEARCGRVGAPGADAVARFAASTEIDLLSVDVGGSEPRRCGSEAEFDCTDPATIAGLCDILPVPLALHGAAAFPPSDLLAREGCRGVVKIDVAVTDTAQCALACGALGRHESELTFPP